MWLQVGDVSARTPLTGLHELFAEPDLGVGGTRLVVASPPTAYVLIGEGELGLEDVTAGAYELTWLSLQSGAEVSQKTITLDGGTERFSAPEDGEVALVLRRIGR